MKMSDHNPVHFSWQCVDHVATVTLNRPERKNPLTFQSYAELRDTFRDLAYAEDVHAVVLTGADKNFSSGGGAGKIFFHGRQLFQLLRHGELFG